MRGIKVGDKVRFISGDTIYTIGDMRSDGGSGEILFQWDVDSSLWSYGEESFNREIRCGDVIILTLPVVPIKHLKRHRFVC